MEERWKSLRRGRGLNWGLEKEGVQIRAREEEGCSQEREWRRPNEAASRCVVGGQRAGLDMGSCGPDPCGQQGPWADSERVGGRIRQ